MARLIDADRLYDKVEARYRQSSGEEHRTERSLLDAICDSPTIYAIPVEWLKSKRKEALHEGMRPDEVEAVEMVLWMWQKEQEAR